MALSIGKRTIGKMMAGMTGAIAAVAIAAPSALALEQVILRLPGVGDLEVTLDELKTFAATGEASGDFGELINDETVQEIISIEQLQKVLMTSLPLAGLPPALFPRSWIAVPLSWCWAPLAM